MGATLCMGKDVRFIQATDGAIEITGTPIESTNISWSSISELKELAARHLGISPEDWPFYEEVELEEDIPLADVRRKCIKLRTVLLSYSEEDLPDDYWIRHFSKLLREGWDFWATAC